MSTRPRYAQARLNFGGRVLGENKNATLQAVVNGVVKDVTDVNQFEGIFSSTEKAVTAEVTATFYDVLPETVYNKLFPGRFKFYQEGTKVVIFLGNRNNYLPDFAEELIIHEEGAANTDRKHDFKFWKAAAVLEGTTLTYDRDTPQDITIKWKIFPDTTKPFGMEYGGWGAWQLTASVALFTFITGNKRSLDYDYGKHLRAVLLKEEERRQLISVSGFFGEGSSAAGDLGSDGVTPVTLTIDEAGNLLPTDDEMTFDALSEASYLQEGMHLKLTSGGAHEWVRCGQVSYTSGTAGTVQFEGQRALFDSPYKLQHANNATCTVYSGIGFVETTIPAVWAETGASVTVGTTDGGAGDDFPGIAAAVANGATQVTATYGGKTSPATVVVSLNNPTSMAASYSKTTTGAQTMLASALYDRSVIGLAIVTEAFADAGGAQTVFEIGETGTTNKFMANTVLVDATLGQVFAFAGTNDSGDAILATATAATGAGTGAIDVFAMAVAQ